jgi:aryl-alcohol dehydrogenase-like predicted oxidoreductase
MTRALGALEVGAIGLGCMGMHYAYTTGTRDDAESTRVVQRAIDLGATLVDTADVYGPYVNEELVGRALRGRRERAVVATKGGLVSAGGDSPGELRPDGRPEHLTSAVEGSLRRLGVDVIDLYQLHRVDPTVPIEESWGALADLVRAGLIRHIGLSEVGVETLERASRVHPVASVQSEFSLWTQDVLAEVLPWCAANGAGLIAYAPLGRGVLTGRYRSHEEFGADDRRASLPRFAPEAYAANLALVDRIAAIAQRHAATPGQVALAWVLAQGPNVVPIAGTKRVAHLEENLGAASVTLSADDLRELASLAEPVGARR